MAKIARSEVTITPRFVVDCKVCLKGVEVDEVFGIWAEAMEAKNRHLAEHEEQA